MPPRPPRAVGAPTARCCRRAGVWAVVLALAAALASPAHPAPALTPRAAIADAGVADDSWPAPVAGQFVVALWPESSAARLAGPAGGLGPDFRILRRLRHPTAVAARPAGRAAFPQIALVAGDPALSPTAALDRLARHPAVRYAEPNGILRVCPNSPTALVPEDFRFPDLWNLDNRGQAGGIPGADLHATAAWTIATGSAAVRVAIIDTGIDFFHPDLEANVWTNPGEIPGNGVDDDGNGLIDDVHGYDLVNDDGDPLDDQIHGSHVAGIVGAVGNNGIGIAGVAWRTSLMAIKAFNERGEGTLYAVLEGIDYAIANGARILNASWMSPDRSRALGEAIVAAHDAGLVVVAAAGNNRTDVIGYPAAYPETIAVAATNNRDRRSLFSNYGPHVTLAAPGESILSTIPDNRYELASGTSMAAPHVAGIAALVLGLHPDLSNTAIEDILRSACDALDSPEYIGLGRANAAKAVRAQPPFPRARLRLPAVLAGVVDLQGTAASSRLSGYTIELGRGAYPTNWTPVSAGDRPVEDGPLVRGFSTAGLPEGDCVLRLTVRDSIGQEAFDLAAVAVRNVYLDRPAHNDFRRAGDLLPLEGTVFGPGRTYTIEVGLGWKPTAWSTAGVHLLHDGLEPVLDGRLGTWDTRTAQTNEFYAIRLVAREGARVVGESISHVVYLDGTLRQGWPCFVEVPIEYSTNDWRHVAVADLDRDGGQEIMAVEPGDSDRKAARLLVFAPDGSLRWARPLAVGAPYFDIPVTGDLDGDGQLEVLVDVGTPGQIFAFSADGSPLGGSWPVRPGAHALGKTLADLDDDGRLELLALGVSDNPDSAPSRVLLVLDAQGRLLRRWAVPDCVPEVDVPRQTPAVGNFDDDPELEIVAPYGCSGLAWFDLGLPSAPAWQTATVGAIYGSPAVADLDGDGRPETIVGLYDSLAAGRPGTHGGVAAFNRRGLLLPGWPVRVEDSFASTPALGDVDGDGHPEIVLAAWSSRTIHVLARNGFELPGWPVGPMNTVTLRSSPVLADVDADGRPDILIACPGNLSYVANAGSLSSVGGVKAWNGNGNPLDLNPRSDQTALLIESSGGTRLKAAPPILTDLDRNGRLDIVATTVEDRTFPPPPGKGRLKNRFTLCVWELDVPFDPAAAPWPMFQHDPQHSGWLPSPPPVNHPPTLAPIPNQTVRTGTPFFPIELDRHAEDPDTPPPALGWSVLDAVELQVTVTPQHVLEVNAPDPAWQGSETLRIVVRDPGGLAATNTARFAARLDYEPPVAVPDTATTLEDASVDLTILANDSHPRGLPLELLGFNRARHGTLELAAPDRLRYRPATNFFGADSATYVVGDGADGMAIGRVTLEVLPVPDPPTPVADLVITSENAPVTLDLLANDSDPDGDPLRLLDFTQPLNGSTTLAASDTVLYQPRPHWAGIDRFTYRVIDTSGLVADSSVTLQVKPVNEAPAAQDLAFTLNRNTQLDVVFQATDPDGDTLSYQIVTGPAHGELWAYPAIATYYPARGFAGTDSFTYTARDAEFTSPPATVLFRVLDANNPPVAKDQDLRTRGGRPLRILLDAADPDADPLTYAVLDPPAHGTLIGTNAVLAYTPDPGYLGDDRFTFVARDLVEPGQPGSVNLHVTDRNTAPVAQTYTLHVPTNLATNLSLLALDAENDPLTFTLLTPPAHGQLAGVAPDLIFNPTSGYYGPDKLTFTAADDQFTSEPGTVSLWIYPPNRPPSATNLLLATIAGARLTFALPAADADGNPLRAAILRGPSHGRVFGLGTNYTYVPNPGYVGLDQFTFRVWDGLAYSPGGEVTLLIRSPGPPVPPRFEGIKVLDDGVVQLRLSAAPGRPLDLLVSTNASTWSLLTSTTPVQDTVTLLDTAAPGQRSRFYRALNPLR